MSTIAYAAKRLANGDVVALPTETVYGLGALCHDDSAVQKIFQIKGRPSCNPLIIHVRDLVQAEKYGVFDYQAKTLVKAFWPGPLTLVVPLLPKAKVSRYVTAGLDTIAIRCPSHPIAQNLLSLCSSPIAAPSANTSGYVSSTRFEHVYQEFGDKVTVIESDRSIVGLESTIVDCSESLIKILRPGKVTQVDLENVLNSRVSTSDTKAGSAIKAPGQLKHHYSPRAEVRLNATYKEEDEAVLDFGASNLRGGGFGLNLSPEGNLPDAAANLFDFLRHLDTLGYPKIAVAPIPNKGIGVAVNERLSRAALRKE